MADIFGVRVTPDLDTLGSFIICNNPGGQIDPAVVFNGENFLVVWSDPAYDRSPGIVVARVTPQGAVIDSGIQVSEGDAHPDIIFDGSRSLVVWSEEFLGVQGRFVNNSAQPEDTVFTIARIAATSTEPKIAFGNGVYLIVYADFCTTGISLDVYGQLVSSQGQLIGNKILIADGPMIQSNPDIDYDGTNFIVVWSQGSYDVYGQLVSTAGFPVGEQFRISQDTSYSKEYPVVAAGLDNYLFVWGEYHDDSDIYGNIDIEIGIDEEITKEISYILPSIISGPLILDNRSKVIVYDVMGRAVSPDKLKPGIYFVITNSKAVQKVVKLK
jgi:hypothetical protein